MGALGRWGWDRVLLGKTVRERDREGKKDVWVKYFDITTSSTLYLDIWNIENPKLPTKNRSNVRDRGASGTQGTVMVAEGWLGGWCMVTVAHALVHGIRGTVSNLLFRLYVGQEWLSLATLSTGGVPELGGEEVNWCYLAAFCSIESPLTFYMLVCYLFAFPLCSMK